MQACEMRFYANTHAHTGMNCVWNEEIYDSSSARTTSFMASRTRSMQVGKPRDVMQDSTYESMCMCIRIYACMSASSIVSMPQDYLFYLIVDKCMLRVE